MKYRPSNGTEGAIFQERFCDRCAHDNYNVDSGEGKSCDILMRTMLHGVDEPEYPEEWQQKPGQPPQCTAFWDANDEPPKDRCPNTVDLFSDLGDLQ